VEFFKKNQLMSEGNTREEQTTKKKGKKPEQAEMSFLDHLEELRWHIVRSAAAIFLFAIIAFIMKEFIFDVIILHPRLPDFWTNRMFAKLGDLVGSEAVKINQVPLKMQSINIAGQFSTHIMVSIIAGFIVASPVVFYEFWKFIKPALKDNEKRHAGGAVFFKYIHLILGILFWYYLIVTHYIHLLGK
jgi:sec-independent protein translocase protein TatC